MIETRGGYLVTKVEECHDMIVGLILIGTKKLRLHWHADGRFTPAKETDYDIHPDDVARALAGPEDWELDGFEAPDVDPLF